MKWDMEEYFPCYSPNLKEFLTENGVAYNHTYIHHVTHKRGWIYKRDEKLSKLLTFWTNNKNSQNT